MTLEHLANRVCAVTPFPPNRLSAVEAALEGAIACAEIRACSPALLDGESGVLVMGDDGLYFVRHERDRLGITHLGSLRGGRLTETILVGPEAVGPPRTLSYVHPLGRIALPVEDDDDGDAATVRCVLRDWAATPGLTAR